MLNLQIHNIDEDIEYRPVVGHIRTGGTGRPDILTRRPVGVSVSRGTPAPGKMVEESAFEFLAVIGA